MFPSVSVKRTLYIYSTYIGLNGLLFLGTTNWLVLLFTLILFWFGFSNHQQIVHADGEYLFNSTVLFDRFVQRFGRRIHIPDIQRVSIGIRSFRLYSWKELVIQDKNGRTIHFTMNMYDPRDIQNIVLYIMRRNPAVNLDPGVNEIAVQGTTRISDEVHAQFDQSKLKLVFLIIVFFFLLYFLLLGLKPVHM